MDNTIEDEEDKIKKIEDFEVGIPISVSAPWTMISQMFQSDPRDISALVKHEENMVEKVFANPSDMMYGSHRTFENGDGTYEIISHNNGSTLITKVVLLIRKHLMNIDTIKDLNSNDENSLMTIFTRLS